MGAAFLHIALLNQTATHFLMLTSKDNFANCTDLIAY